ncbi:amino acid/polyamine transporter I [Nemania sp. NC0429]|nr:amino acid/polyamine transporter I [Nemania sp. NC0429]
MGADGALNEGVQMDLHQSETHRSSSRDDAALARLGKKSVLKRSFGFWTILGFSCTVLITWEGSLIVFLVGLQNGGPSGIIYGFIVVWIGTLSVFATLSEMASMAPTSGGQYHWVSMLAPPTYRKFLSYITGWLTLTGWQASVASTAYLTGTAIQGLIVLTHTSYLETMQNWHGTLLLWAIVILSYGVNTAFASSLSRFEGLVLVFHILGFFAIIFPLVFLSEHATADTVFNTFLNIGEWQTQGLSFNIGILGSVYAFVGGDGAIHMAEEVHNPAVLVPWSIMTGLLINGVLGFAMLIATLYCMGDINVRLKENPIYPFMAIFHHAVGSTAGAAVMSALVVILVFSATTGLVSSTSRVYWAFARDRALPGWEILRRVSRRTSIPIFAVITTIAIAVILSFVNIGSSTAFNGILSVSVAGLFGSYLVAASLLLYRRLTGGIRERNSGNSGDSGDSGSYTSGSTLSWGPWRVPGALGVANNTFACVYLIYIFFFSFWPAYSNVTPQNMNWAALVFSVVILFSVMYYAVWARKLYNGPVVETGLTRTNELRAD